MRVTALASLRTLRTALGLSLVLASACSDDDGGDSNSDASRPPAVTDAGGDAIVVADDGGAGGPQVTVAEGKLEGKVVGSTRQFLGIPYAQPPIDALRFAPPLPALPYAIRRAVEFGPSCPQSTGALSAMGAQSEDCLSLNVVTPSNASKLPVMVWIHGGAFVSGGSVQYDGARLSSDGNVVVVTLNYRLGVLGLLSHPALDSARGTTPSGNDALRDQQLALRWVKKNIAAFGGDPDNVTVFGESAGSMSACLQLVSPTSRDLAKRFILQSGSCVGGLPIANKATANALGEELATAFCTGQTDLVTCLRSKSADELVGWGAARGISGAGWSPLADSANEVLPDAPSALIEKGDFNHGEVLLGTNKNEWGLFLALQAGNPITNVAGFDAAVEAQFGAAAASAIKQHYAATDATARDTFVRLMTDATFRCPTRKLVRALNAKNTKAFLYSFEEGAAQHAFEIPYVFGNPNPLLAPTLVESARATIQSYWLQFARKGNPNGDGQPPWQAYSQDSDPHMTLQAVSAAASGLAAADCDFWASLRP